MDKIYSLQYEGRTYYFKITPECKGLNNGSFTIDLHAELLGEAANQTTINKLYCNCDRADNLIYQLSKLSPLASRVRA